MRLVALRNLRLKKEGGIMSKSKFAREFAGKRFLSIWGSLLWRGVVYGIFVGFALGTLAGVAVESAGRPDQVNLLEAMLGIMFLAPTALGIRAIVLKKRYPSSNTRLVPQDLAA